ncbi:hypothetical protein D3C83_03430 [compost metagenome]
MLLSAQGRQQAGTRHDVVHEACRQGLSRLLLVHDLFAEHLAGALHHTAVELTFDDRVVDDGAAIIHCTIGNDFCRTRFRIDFDFGNVAAVGKGRAELAFGLDAERLLLREFGEFDSALRLG